jgi:Uma2 family endonuclease
MSKNTVNEPAGEFSPSSGYTYADYLKFEFEEMVELIRGKIFRMSPAPRTYHQVISLQISRILGNYFIHQKCQVFHAPTDVVLPVANKKKEQSTTVVQPDICVVCDATKIEELCIFGAPDLIIEILSPHTRKKDLQYKYDVYEEAGVREYWIVMPDEKLVEVFVLEKNEYKRIQTYTETDTVPCVIFEGLIVDLNEVFIKKPVVGN